MEQLRDLAAGPGSAPGALDGILTRIPTPAKPPARPFAAELFEEGARAGLPRDSLARRVAALDRAPRPGMGDRLAPDLDRRGYAPETREGRGHAPGDQAPEIDLSLDDLIDVINPLHHIPIVANLYRGLTGDTISAPARVAGGALYGGPLGMVAGMVTAIAAQVNGADPGDALVASLFGERPPGDPPAEVLAQAPVPDPAPVSAPALVSAASVAPQVQARVLSGDAALSALFGDFQARGAAVVAPASNGALEARTKAATASEAEASAVAIQGFSARMTQGLAKYRAMAIERGGAGRPAPKHLDRRL